MCCVWTSPYDDVCEHRFCVYPRSTCANILVANYFYKLGFSLRTHCLTHDDTILTGINTLLVLIFSTIFHALFTYVPLFTFHRSLIFRLITCSTEHKQQQLHCRLYSYSNPSKPNMGSQLSTRRSIRFNSLIFFRSTHQVPIHYY